jgi:microcompartment protein CcmL/EutN
VTEQVSDVTKAMTETIGEYFDGDSVGSKRFIGMLHARVQATLQRRKEAKFVIEVEHEPAQVDAIEAGNVEPVKASEARSDDAVAPGPAPATDAVPPA